MIFDIDDSAITRKARTRKEISTLFWPELTRTQMDALKALPRVPGHHGSPDTNRSVLMNQREVMLQRDKSWYYVNTEGYSYLRYAVRIASFPG